jgi:hypothetical protein
MFQITEQEYKSLRSRSVTLKLGRGKHRKYLPLVFTEQGVAMLSAVLKSPRALEVKIAIIRVFVKLRELVDTNRELSKKIDQLERKLLHNDDQFKEISDAICRLMAAGSPLHQKRIKGLGGN